MKGLFVILILPMAVSAQTPKAESWRKDHLELYTGESFDAGIYTRSQQSAQALSANRAAFNWVGYGPRNMGGRSLAIHIDVNNPDHILAGGITGGLFQSWNGGQYWEKVAGFNDNLSVSCITQSDVPPYRILVGTGSITNLIPGKGVYESTDNGVIWNNIPFNVNCNSVQDVHAIPGTDKFLIAGQCGFYRYEGSLGTISSEFSTSHTCKSFEISHDGSVIIGHSVIGSSSNIFYSNNSGQSYTETSMASFLGMSVAGTNIGLKFAISAERINGNYLVYGFATDITSWKELYMSTNNGVSGSWESPDISGTGLIEFYPWAMDLSIHPNDPYFLCAGGRQILGITVDPSGPPYTVQWEELSTGYPNLSDPTGMGHGINRIEWKDTTAYFATDQGLFKSTSDYAGSFISLNNNYVTTLCMDVSTNRHGEMLIGTENSYALYNDFSTNQYDVCDDIFAAYLVSSADIAFANDSIFIVQVFPNSIFRSTDKGQSWHLVVNSIMDLNSVNSYLQPRAFEEMLYDSSSTDSLTFHALMNYSAGDTISTRNRTGYLIGYELSSNLNAGDSIRIQDIYQSWYAVASPNSLLPNSDVLWLTREITRLDVQDPFWWGIEFPLGNPRITAIDFSSDGDKLWVSVSDDSTNQLYRISGLNTLYANSLDSGYSTNDPYDIPSTVLVELIGNFGGPISSIASDVNDPEHLVITFAVPGIPVVQETFQAATGTALNFANAQGNLPTMPVYCSRIDNNNPDMITVGSEFGVYSSSDGGTNWSNSNGDFGMVPVYSIKQNKFTWDEGNYTPGEYYIATYGRGVWKSTDFLEVDEPAYEIKNDLIAYPNPSSGSFTIVGEGYGKLYVYSMDGKCHISRSIRGNTRIETEGLPSGIYLLRVETETGIRTGKLVIQS